MIESNADELLTRVKTEYGDMIRGALCNSLPSTDVDDVEATIYASLWISLKQFRGQSSLKSFIYPIVRRRIADYFKSRYRGQRDIDVAKVRLVEMMKEPSVEKDSELFMTLTAAELNVFRCLSIGMTNPEIAKALFISVYTVRTHVKSLYKKTGMPNRWALILLARRFWSEG